MIIYNSTWSIVIQYIRIILSGDNIYNKMCVVLNEDHF